MKSLNLKGSPFGPLSPSAPRSPGVPGSPFGPGNPTSPLGPLSDALKDDEACKITLSLDTNTLEAGKYQWDLFLWNGDRPIKCLVKGQVNVIEGISNRGK